MTRTGTSTVRELTVRSVVLGGLITLVFTAANVYLGLKVGLTFAIVDPGGGDLDGDPALLQRPLDPREQHRPDGRVGGRHALGDHLRAARPGHDRLVDRLPVLDDRCSSARSAACSACMFSVPLRRALVTGSDLPYPEGVAAAEVLKVGGHARGARRGARGQPAQACARSCSARSPRPGSRCWPRSRLVGTRSSATFRVGAGGTAFGASLSLALIGVGHLVGRHRRHGDARRAADLAAAIAAPDR